MKTFSEYLEAIRNPNNKIINRISNDGLIQDYVKNMTEDEAYDFIGERIFKLGIPFDKKDMPDIIEEILGNLRK